MNKEKTPLPFLFQLIGLVIVTYSLTIILAALTSLFFLNYFSRVLAEIRGYEEVDRLPPLVFLLAVILIFSIKLVGGWLYLKTRKWGFYLFGFGSMLLVILQSIFSPVYWPSVLIPILLTGIISLKIKLLK